MGKITSFGDKQSQQWSKKTSFGRQKIPAMGQKKTSFGRQRVLVIKQKPPRGKGQKTLLRETNNPSNGTRNHPSGAK